MGHVSTYTFLYAHETLMKYNFSKQLQFCKDCNFQKHPDGLLVEMLQLNNITLFAFLLKPAM
jgi:hypothetical protein